MNIFQGIGKIVENIFATIQNASLNDKFIQLQSIVSILIVLSIMYKGYQTMAGKSQDPIRELVWDIARKLLILTFILNVNGWLNSAISALDGIYAWAGGGSQFYAQLDQICVSFGKSLQAVIESNETINPFLAITNGLIILVMVLSFLGLIITFAFTIIATSITNTFLIIALPLALFCFMYENTKQVFVQWMNMFISNVFLLIFMSCFADFLIKHMAALYGDVKVVEDSLVASILQPILISGILVTCIGVIKSLASNLAQVTLDSASASGLQSFAGSAGKGAGMTARGAGKLALGAFSGSARKAESRGGMTGIAGFAAKKAMSFAANKATGGLAGAASAAKNLLSKARNG
ncbi:hypothetical protein DMB95_09225 [Campylobacter sp. MIT 12-8780]|uniref:type IV secretion system protein n=1 Tax=unclassified Campylobacter TaxID=2593542 RepID=UPI00115E6556|nr:MULTISPECIES: type IV secretion system protein [unclassified Campylobacter]NDJ28072.1 type IV secretion system protein [Campylobacter sp. MIT 19-121]TQR39963.1 hypothetical protein DMB95_09225 [Campylobacter sp. MIT 12-8780]